MKANELLRMLKRAGWYVEARTLFMKHPDRGKEFTSVPNHGSAEVAKGLLMDIKKRAGI